MSTEAAVRYRLRLKAGRERSLELAHPWVFSGAVAEVEALPNATPGDLGDVLDHDGRFLARGTVQPESQILCRILSFEERPIDRAFFEGRLARAIALRRRIYSEDRTNGWRAVHSEGDELPGLIVDRYDDVLAVQTLTAGMLRLRPLWLPLLEEMFSPRAIVERGSNAAREELASSEKDGTVLAGTLDSPIRTIRENGVTFAFDITGGQKTGFYLDQRENRALARSLAKGAEVLDLFGYTGAFSVQAGAGGAARVLSVEGSAPARELAVRNWSENGLDPARFEAVSGDAFSFLRHETRTFDLLVLDPPPLARDRGSLERALRAYKDLHLWAFARARPGAFVLSFSCSQHVTPDLFQKVVFGAARDVGAAVQWLGRLSASADHPVHLDHPQGEYLKGLWMRVLTPGEPPSRRSVPPDADGETR